MNYRVRSELCRGGLLGFRRSEQRMYNVLTAEKLNDLQTRLKNVRQKCVHDAQST